jgi:hypothetical protein
VLRSDGFSDRFLQVSSPTIGAAALNPGYRPQNAAGVPQNAAGVPAKRSRHAAPYRGEILLEPHGAGTKYTAIAIHGDEEGAKKRTRTWASTTIGAKASTNSSPSRRKCAGESCADDDFNCRKVGRPNHR